MKVQGPALFEAPLAHEVHQRTSFCNCRACRNNRDFEAELEWESHKALPEVDYFVTKLFPGLTEGHEILTDRAATPFGLSPIQLAALKEGTTRPDKGTGPLGFIPAVIHSFFPGEQKRHFLRRELGTPMSAALAEIYDHFRTLHEKALLIGRGGATKEAFVWIGEALHLLQDSYSDAHTERAFASAIGDPHPIRYIRFFANVLTTPPTFGTSPREHNVFPPDPRDQIFAPTGTPPLLKFESQVAIFASSKYIEMLLLQIARGGPISPLDKTEREDFIRRYLS